MVFQVGDPVMHWTYGLGRVVRLEERALAGQKSMYYAVQVRDLTVWVPADAKLESRLRPPTSKTKFKHMLSILTNPGEPLPDDRQERKVRLQAMLQDGRAESLCRVIRDLTAYRKVRALNDHDQAILKRSQDMLLGEWGFALSLTAVQAEVELHRILAHRAEGN